jgi:hypothetical protein
MRISLEDGVDNSLARGFVQGLAAALARESFSESCGVGNLGGFPTVYLKCPRTPRGLIADTRRQDAEHYKWIRDELEASVIDGRLKGL